MKKSLFLAVILIIGVLGYSLNISVSIYPYYLVLKDIVSNEDQINIIVPAGKSPHTYSVSSKDLIKIYKSDLVVFNGLNSEVFLNKVITNIKKKNISYIFAGEVIPRDMIIDSNPHIWLDPELMYKYIIPEITNKLILLNPEKKELYSENSKKLIKKLELMDEYLKIKSSEINGSIITFHNSFPYFARHYNIKIAGVIEKSPGVEPSIADMKKLYDSARKNNIKGVFSEPQLNQKIAEKVARTLKVNLGMLDPLGNSFNSIDELYLINFLNILNTIR
ncbi:hypothetical protein XO10_10320 [Marinitoga sp. 1135]|uniref:metal ABC transporter substrate-binding protein n=1 Tax=Marinitoga sp. 1135 TaxID=1643333 RepID=UPI0015863FC1|nr:metal ABC transporter substrate-binding protein [Marinitoga sp. 1135]NUU96619.1 hypothetical protein [Marinitoga sp. 1135]